MLLCVVGRHLWHEGFAAHIVSFYTSPTPPPLCLSPDNSVNGVTSCASDWLLGTLLRDSWQFDGYVTSDCDADSDVYNSHHYTATPELAVQAVLRAGT